MPYLRIRNGYAYICQKVKVNGRWKEETIERLGKIIPDEVVKRWNWLKERSERLDAGKNISKADFEKLRNDILETLKFNKVRKRDREDIADFWLYKTDSEEILLITTTSGMCFTSKSEEKEHFCSRGEINGTGST